MSLIMSLIHFGLFTDRYERLEQQYGNQPGIQMSCNTYYPKTGIYLAK